MERESLIIIDKLLVENKYDLIDASKLQNLMHHHNAYEIMFLIKSDNLLFIKNTCYKMLSNQIVFIAPYTIHSIIYNDQTEYQRIVLNFEKEFVEDVLELCGCQKALNVFYKSGLNVANLDVNSFNRVNRIFTDFNTRYIAYMRDKNEISLAKLKLALCSHLLELYESFGTGDARSESIVHNETVKEIIRFLDEKYMEDISLVMLAERFHISKFYISRLFKTITGASIIDYLQLRRIIEAQKMLLTSDASITTISYECGFNSIQHFYRVFKKVTNTTPSLWCLKSKL